MLNRKALSPVVASIILIAVIVAVSITVAAWMGIFNTPQMGPPNSIAIWADFSDPHVINVTLKNFNPSAIYPKNLLINNVSVYAPLGDPFFGYPVTVVTSLPGGSSHTSSINYSWTYNSDYRVTLVWWNSNHGNEDTSKEYNFSVGFTSPPKPQMLNLALLFPPPEFNNADHVIWSWDYYSNNYPQYTSNMTMLPASITIDATAMPNGTMLKIQVSYYQLQLQTPALFEYLGEKDYLLIVEK